MFRLVTAFLALLMLAPASAVAQSRKQDSRDRRPYSNDMVARMAYSNTYWPEGKNLRQACFALYDDGHYQLLRLTTDGGRESLQGYLGSKELIRFLGMLLNLNFGRSGGGAILRDSEFFMADIARDNKIVRHTWLDPDGRRPLPDSAVKIVHWLQAFHPQNASPVPVRELTDQSVCPAARWEELPGRLSN